jgi:hypothetical protein
VSPKSKPNTGVSTPKTDNLDDLPQEGEGRSILDFGKAKPGEELQTPTIVVKVPITPGATNIYVNFMRKAEEKYGWDALHPRLAANRDRKARIAAAAASLEKVESGRESGDEMSEDLSDVEGSNPENGGTSGPDALAKPKKKKRNFKEDQYDVDDDFVDDSEMLWEAQAAASRDGFFVYSGPLVPEEQKPEPGYVAIFYSVFPVANKLTVVRTALSEAAGLEAALAHVVDEVPPAVHQDQVLAAGRAPAEVLSRVSRASRSRRSSSANVRRRRGRASRWDARPRATTFCNLQQRPRLLSAS